MKEILPVPSPITDESLLKLLQEHFWCDFSDFIPSMTWDGTKSKH